MRVADDVNEKDGKWSVQHHLKNGVDSDEDGTMFFITAGEAIPDQNLVFQSACAQRFVCVTHHCDTSC